jgi:alpha-tubulin suppressor-like RCC1 family protein
VEAGTFHSMAIVTYPPVLDGGYLYTWGSGFYGQLAQGATTVKSEPTIVEYFVLSHLMIKQVSAGAHHCLALTKENELFSWGNNLHGALGRYEETMSSFFLFSYVISPFLLRLFSSFFSQKN